LVLGSTLALAACGGGAEEADEPVASQTDAVTTPASGDSAAAPTEAAPASGETPGEAPGETSAAEPLPTPSASATAAAAAPAAAASAAPVAVAAKPPEFAVCAACHSTEPGKNGLGPTLAGVFGAKAGHIDDFNYSEAMES